jgi:hypothetical protein
MRISVRHVPNWGAGFDHIEVRSIEPEQAPLPITETGYKSHFIHGEELAEHGGPVSFVTAWLEHEAKSEGWQMQRQMSLF